MKKLILISLLVWMAAIKMFAQYPFYDDRLFISRDGEDSLRVNHTGPNTVTLESDDSTVFKGRVQIEDTLDAANIKLNDTNLVVGTWQESADSITNYLPWGDSVRNIANDSVSALRADIDQNTSDITTNTTRLDDIGVPFELSDYDIGTSDQTFNLSPITDVTGIYFRPDGSDFFIVTEGTDSLVKYSMSTPWDLSTASRAQGVGFGSSNKSDLFFSPRGDYVYYARSVVNIIYQYTMSTPWDLSTIAADGTYTPSEVSDLWGAAMSHNGEKLYLGDIGNDSIFQYTMSTNYDVATASYDNQARSVINPYTISISPYSINFFVGTSNSISSYYNYINSNISNLTLLSSETLSLGNFNAVFVSSNGKYMYVIGNDNGSAIVNRYTILP